MVGGICLCESSFGATYSCCAFDASCIHGDGSHTRRFIHSRDVADAVDLIIHRGEPSEIYNIGTQNEISNLELAKRLIQILDKPGDPNDYIELVRDRAFNDKRYAIDSTKLNQMGWNPQISFEEGLLETGLYCPIK